MLAVCSALGSRSVAAADGDVPRTPREILTCDKEHDRFSLWSRVAGTSSSDVTTKLPNAVLVAIRMSDDRTIRGILFPATERARGAVLVIQGNARRAENFSRFAPILTSAMFDVFVFDFRGYSLSKPGYPTMRGTSNWVVPPTVSSPKS